MIVYTSKTLDKELLTKIKLKNSVNIGSYIFYNILLKNKPLLIQTPRLYCEYGINNNKYDKDTYSISLLIDDFIDFYIFIKDIDKFLSEKTSSNLFTIKNNRINLKIHKKIKPLIFDIYKNEISLENVMAGSWISSIIYPKHVWKNENTYGITWYVLQMMVMTPVPIINKCLFFNDNNDNKDNNDNEENKDNNDNDNNIIPIEYNKYIKMKNLGIPIGAIEVKCKIDGLDLKILHQYINIKNNDKNNYKNNDKNNDKNNYDINVCDNNNNNNNNKNYINDIVNFNKNLKKINSFDKNNKIDKNKETKLDPRIPSLEMILSKLKNLKKI